MANYIKFEITEKEINDSTNTIEDKRLYTFSSEYTESQKGKISILSGSPWITISFVQISESVLIRLNTDYQLKIKLNSGSEEFDLNKNIILEGGYTAISVKNESGSTAILSYEIYG